MSSRLQNWSMRLLPFLCIPLMGGDCEGRQTRDVAGLVLSIFQLVLSIIDVAD